MTDHPGDRSFVMLRVLRRKQPKQVSNPHRIMSGGAMAVLGGIIRGTKRIVRHLHVRTSLDP